MEIETKLYEKVVECYIFNLLNTLGTITLFSGKLENKLGDAFFSSTTQSNDVAAVLLEFKAIRKDNTFSTIFKKEKDKFSNSNFDLYLNKLKTAWKDKNPPHVLLYGELKRFPDTQPLIGGCNYGKFLSSEGKECEDFKINWNYPTENLKEELSTFLEENGTTNKDDLIRYIKLLFESRIGKESTSSGGDGFSLEDLLVNIRVVFVNNQQIEVASLGEILNIYAKDLGLQKEISQDMDNKEQNPFDDNLYDFDNYRKGGSDLSP